MIFETYIEQWQPLANSMAALQAMTITPSTTINIAFASFNFSWGGADWETPIIGGLSSYGLTLADIDTIITYVHSKGGKVKLSLGGANSVYYLTEALQCPSGTNPCWGSGTINIGSMAEFLVEVVNYYGFDGVDLDLENPSTPTYNAAFATAVANMVSQFRGATKAPLSLTIKGQDWTGFTKPLLQQSMPNFTTVNFMEYDLWMGSAYPAQIQADMSLYTGSTSKTFEGGDSGWGLPTKVSVIGLMPGPDDLGNDLTLSQAQAITQYAQANGFAGIMMWDANRDYAGIDGNPSMAYTNMIQKTLGLT